MGKARVNSHSPCIITNKEKNARAQAECAPSRAPRPRAHLAQVGGEGRQDVLFTLLHHPAQGLELLQPEPQGSRPAGPERVANPLDLLLHGLPGTREKGEKGAQRQRGRDRRGCGPAPLPFPCPSAGWAPRLTQTPLHCPTHPDSSSASTEPNRLRAARRNWTWPRAARLLVGEGRVTLPAVPPRAWTGPRGGVWGCGLRLDRIPEPLRNRKPGVREEPAEAPKGTGSGRCAQAGIFVWPVSGGRGRARPLRLWSVDAARSPRCSRRPLGVASASCPWAGCTLPSSRLAAGRRPGLASLCWVRTSRHQPQEKFAPGARHPLAPSLLPVTQGSREGTRPPRCPHCFLVAESSEAGISLILLPSAAFGTGCGCPLEELPDSPQGPLWPDRLPFRASNVQVS